MARISAVLSFFFQGAFLPTMPEDDVAAVREALLGARTATGEENPFIWSGCLLLSFLIVD
jgi:hypothetical protein